MISVVIPAYNEERRIVKTLKAIGEYFRSQDHEIILVNDGSKDATVDKALELKIESLRIVSYDRNRGKGYAVKQGMLAAKGDLVLLSDADLSTPIEEYEKLKEFISDHPVVIGSRGMKDSKVKNRWYRVLLGRIGNLLIRSVVPGIADTQCGFKLFNGEVVSQIFSRQRIKKFGFDFEILFIARKHKLKIKEVPVEWENAADSKVRAQHYITTFADLFRVVMNNLSGRYR